MDTGQNTMKKGLLCIEDTGEKPWLHVTIATWNNQPVFSWGKYYSINVSGESTHAHTHTHTYMHTQSIKMLFKITKI
jgi:hypothetical protein